MQVIMQESVQVIAQRIMHLIMQVILEQICKSLSIPICKSVIRHMKVIVQAYESNCTSRKKIIQLGIMRLNILISLKSLMKVFMEIRQFREVNHYTNS